MTGTEGAAPVRRRIRSFIWTSSIISEQEDKIKYERENQGDR